MQEYRRSLVHMNPLPDDLRTMSQIFPDHDHRVIYERLDAHRDEVNRIGIVTEELLMMPVNGAATRTICDENETTRNSKVCVRRRGRGAGLGFCCSRGLVVLREQAEA